MRRHFTFLLAISASIGTAVSAHDIRDAVGDVASTSTSAAAVPTLVTSTDGTCGNGITCEGSTAGKCCSAHGYCGDGDAYCGAGCNSVFGSCNAGTGSGGSGSSPPAPAPTSVVWLTETTTISRTDVATRIVTSTSVSVTVSTSFVTSTATVTSGVKATQTATVTSTAVVTRTSTLVSISTLTTTTAVASTVVSTVLRTSVTIVTSTATVTATVAGNQPPAPTTGPGRPTGSPNPVPTVTTTVIVFGPGGNDGSSTTLWFPQPTRGRNPPAATPSPILKGAVSDCTKYYKVQAGDTCDTVADKEDVPLVKLLTWNTDLTRGVIDSLLCGVTGLLPIVSTCKTSCDKLPTGYYVCVGV